MAQLVVKRGPPAATKDENVLQDWDGLLHSIPKSAVTKEDNILQDWDNFLYGIWLEKIAANPGVLF
jgi:hypothetical protein